MSVDFSTQEAMEGSSITLSTTLTGTGKFHGIKSIPISYADNTFEIFSSKSNIIEKEKIPVGKKWETLLIPKKPGKLDITIDEFIYFDSELREYKNIPAQTYSFTISKDPNKKAQVTYSDSNEYKTENSTVKKEIFISNILGKKSNISTNKSFLKIMIIMYAVFFIVTLLILIFFHYVLPFMKQVTQKPEQMLLSQIDTVLKDNKSSAMIRLQKLYNSFEKYLSSSFDIDSLQIQKNKIAQAIGEKLPPEELDKLKSIIGDFDFFRFGATDVNDETIVGLARDVKALTRNISKVQMERVK